ncbi:hypothetical protein C8J56DRAFT_901029 [Mycena floridula]|nr:hypothetical protein C8J56DRAFT_901029 [Mycena floridula]
MTKAARMKSKSQKLAPSGDQQISGSADNPGDGAGTSNENPPSNSVTSFPGPGNTTGGTMATAGSLGSVASQPSYSEFRHRSNSSILSSVPSAVTIHSQPADILLPTIDEGEIARSDVGGTGRTGARNTSGNPSNPSNDSLRSVRACSSRNSSSAASRDSDDEMSESARRLHRADKQPHHRVNIPKGLDNVQAQEAIFLDARRRSEENQRWSASSLTLLYNNAMSSMSNLIINQLNGQISDERLNEMQNLLSTSGILNETVDQLLVPRSTDETDEEYRMRQNSLLRLREASRFTTTAVNPTTIEPVNIISQNTDAIGSEPNVNGDIPSAMEINQSVFAGPPSWRNPAPPSYSVNPRLMETAVVVPVAGVNDEGIAIRRTRPERAARMRRLYREAGAGSVTIGNNELPSDSSDLGSQEEIERIQEMLERRGPSSGDWVTVSGGSSTPPPTSPPTLLDASVRRENVNPRTDELSDSTTSSAHVQRLARLADRANQLFRNEERIWMTEIARRDVLNREAAERAANEARVIAEGVKNEADTDALAGNANNVAPAENAPVERIPRNVDFAERVALQRTRFNQLRDFGASFIEDQGIGFDFNGNPFERDLNAEHERDALAAYFLRNNLDPGLAFGQNVGQNEMALAQVILIVHPLDNILKTGSGSVVDAIELIRGSEIAVTGHLQKITLQFILVEVVTVMKSPQIPETVIQTTQKLNLLSHPEEDVDNEDLVPRNRERIVENIGELAVLEMVPYAHMIDAA